jgi:hypothetical protein
MAHCGRFRALWGHVGVNDVITVMGYTRVSRMTLAFYYMPAGAPGMAR